MTSFLSQFHGPVIYLVVAGLLVAESGFGVGFFVPGELSMVLGGVLAREHRVDIVVMVIVAVVAAIGSYLIGYGVGRAILPRVLERTRFGRHPMVQRAREQLAERGGPAIFLARFVVVVRAVMPALAGSSELRLGTFALYDVAGGLVWATLYTLIGYAVGSAYQQALHTIGVWSYVVVAVLAVGFVGFHLVRSRRQRREATEGALVPVPVERDEA